jgi:hypothetical protein
MAYDSAEETMMHVERVCLYLNEVIARLAWRGVAHDASKFRSPEKEVFDQVSPLLSSMVYGSDEYKAALERLQPALAHHYAHNPHHPEHYANGIAGMSMIDLIEMLCDWKAAGERRADGNMADSLRINRERFAIDDQLAGILENTARELGWLTVVKTEEE